MPACCCLPKSAFLEADDPRFATTVAAIETDLLRDDFIYRYLVKDDFGEPENAFLRVQLLVRECACRTGTT
jgi:GH15 family glucan-1,4-alpha-glucosidase